ncbi:RAMP superfamily CRISPR-associated protein [Aphanothece minutissima]|uniref:RAMP superfamily CRISPR-associated protein n=1 Tax=Aphanothece minutissima TaxID=543815 RepID=UPI0011B1F39D|nr:RAMP superfamily CRISPR-associated protein [Aphanothece minutissima]
MVYPNPDASNPYDVVTSRTPDRQQAGLRHGEYEAVPMEYRAQIRNRCQRQHASSGHASRWVQEWTGSSSSQFPFSVANLRHYHVQIEWRLITNSGIDAGFIRPVIAAGGWPFLPGSSIKGLFCRACSSLQPPATAERWCGSSLAGSSTSKSLKPGILRFHGAWPTNANWRERLLDVAHPQQNWQLWDPIKNRQSNRWDPKIKHNANALISLYQPELLIGLSSSEPDVAEEEWTQIELTLRAALLQGIGGRTCAGYGSTGRLADNVFFECKLEGQGRASSLLSGKVGEFRPNIFRAAIRGMALRLFGGLCSAEHARRAVGRLFGAIDPRDGGQQRGLLDSVFADYQAEVRPWGDDRNPSHVYAVSGTLQWRLTCNDLEPSEQKCLHTLVAYLHALTFSLAGFGRGWRRPDHFIFFPEYYHQSKPAIGCHWQWSDASILKQHPDFVVRTPHDLGNLLRVARRSAAAWLVRDKIVPRDGIGRVVASWREVIHPTWMNIWLRESRSAQDAMVIHWFHQSPDTQNYGHMDPRRLKGTSLAGRVQRDRNDSPSEVGRVWNRMLPCLDADSLGEWCRGAGSGLAPETACIQAWPGPYSEIVVLFSDRHAMDSDPSHQPDLINCLDAPGSPFHRVSIPEP